MHDTLPTVSIDEIADPVALRDVAGEWDELAGAASTPNIFYEGWMVAAADRLPEAPGLSVLVARDADGRMIGVLPLQPRRVAGGRMVLATQSWDQRVRALGEPLIRAGHECAFWQAAIGYLDRRRGGGRYLRLSALIADSPSTLALHAVLDAMRRPVRVTRTVERAVLRDGLSSAAYVEAHIRKKVLKEQRRLRNRLADQGAVRFDRLAPDADVDPWIDDLFRLEMTGWKGREGVAAAADAQTEACFRAILTEAHARGRLDFHRLRVGDRTLSLLANIEAGDTAFQLKIAYDEEYAAFSPGVLLEMAYLEHALDIRRLASVDSCARAGHPMIDRIWVDRLRIVSLAIPYARMSSRLWCAGQAAAMRLRRSGATES